MSKMNQCITVVIILYLGGKWMRSRMIRKSSGYVDGVCLERILLRGMALKITDMELDKVNVVGSNGKYTHCGDSINDPKET